MATEDGSPSLEPATAPRGRGRGRGGRGRGRGNTRGGNSTNTRAANTTSATVPKATRGNGQRRRGKGKTFADPLVQAAHERATDLKNAFSVVGQVLRTALSGVAEKTIDTLMSDTKAHKKIPGHQENIDGLQEILQKRQDMLDRRLEMDLQRAHQKYHDEATCHHEQYKNAVEDLEDRFLDGLENRIRILEGLEARGLPVDIRDDQYTYKEVDEWEMEEISSLAEVYKDGHLVPYPNRVEGTERYLNSRDREANVAGTGTATGQSGRGRGRGRNAAKRKAGDQPDEQPTPKRSGRNGGHGTKVVESNSAAPAPAKGLLASAASQQPGRDQEPLEESAPASPDAGPEYEGGRNQEKADEAGLTREGSPGPPKWASTTAPDEHDVCTYVPPKAAREKGAASRIFAPRIFKFDNDEIGFRDSSNNPIVSKIPAHKRGKYLHTPHTNGQHLDFWVGGVDYSQLPPDAFPPEEIEKYKLHPRFGIALKGTLNPKETPDPYVMPGKPVVFTAKNIADARHASRSFQATTTGRTLTDAPLRSKIGASLRGFCKKTGVDMDEVAVDDYLPSEAELKDRSLGTASKSQQKTETPGPETSTKEQTPDQEGRAGEEDKAGLALLSNATAFIESQEEAKAAEPAPTPKPTRYDAIRDVFTDTSAHATPARRQERASGLSVLADLCQAEESRGSALHPGPTHGPSEHHGYPGSYREPYDSAPMMDSDLRSTIHAEPEHTARPFNPEPYAPRPEPYEPVSAYHGHGHEVHGSGLPPPPGGMHSATPVEPGQYHPAGAAPASSHLPAPPTNYQGHPYPSPYPGGPPPAPQEPSQGSYYHGHHTGFAQPEPREPHPSFRPSDYGYQPRPSSAYASERSPYSQRGHWSQHPHAGPPGPPGPPQSAQPPGPPSYQSYATPMAHAQTRMSFSSLGDPLPPLRPSRSRTHSIAEDAGYEASLRAGSGPQPPPPPATAASYFPSLTPQPNNRAYHHGYPEQAPMPTASDRAFPSPLNMNYGTSPQQGYSQPVSSPTFANPAYAPVGQSPPTTPLGAPGSAHHHRSTPSGSSDAGSRGLRKLQPAPVPAHRASWANKPELKTIPYDHKETGAAAQLPSSGPTQIRGWNVNQHKKRGKPGGERADSVSERDDPR